MSGSAMRLLVAALLLSTVAATQIDTGATEAQQSEPLKSVALTVPDSSSVKSYWQRRGCNHRHRFLIAHKRVRKTIRNHNPNVNKKRVRHFATCVERRKMSRKLWRFAKKSWQWRKQYEHKWVIEFNRLPEWAQNWAVSTSTCESGMNPRAYNPAPFYGAFQFVLSTWYAAGGTGNPMDHSWHYQAVIAVRWLYQAGDEQWPVCGD